ncbi:hypothetical protein EJ110_NYTH38530 [Nymphaea thermarum]|nr:hypothetical protein EJ110_NYTH38530 [Nymphaea thermarum]
MYRIGALLRSFLFPICTSGSKTAALTFSIWNDSWCRKPYLRERAWRKRASVGGGRGRSRRRGFFLTGASVRRKGKRARRRSVEAGEIRGVSSPGGGLPETEMEQEVATAPMSVATMEEETLPIGDSRCVPGEAISSIGFKKSPVENTCCEEGKSSEGEAVGDPAPFGSVGKRGLPQPPSWADRVAGRGSPREEDLPPLKVIIGEGRPRIVVTEEDLLSMTKPFQWSAVCCFMGSTSKVSGNISKLISGLLTQWMGRISPQISLLNKGDFLIRVTTEEELNLVLQKRVWKVSGRVLVAARWSLGQPLEINPSTTAPLWVRLPGLPPYFWNGRIFKAVAMGLQGDFLEADAPTVHMSRTNFARILLDLPIQSKLPPEVEIDLGGGHILAQATVYEGRLRFCRMCGVNSHPPEKCPKMLNSKVKDDSRTLEAGHMVTGISLNRGNGLSSGARLKHLTAANRFEVLAETEEDQGPHDKTKEWPEKLPQKSEQEGSAPVRAPRGKRGKNILSNSVKDQDNNHISTERLPNPFDSKPLDVPDFPCDVPPGFFFSSSSQPGQDGVASFSSKLGATEGSSAQTFRLSRDAKHISRGRGSRGSKGRNIVKDTSNFNLLLHEDFEGVGSKRKRTFYGNFAPDFVPNPQFQPLESPVGETKEGEMPKTNALP